MCEKILLVWMIFGSKLLSSFAVSHLRVSAIYTLFSSIYATERQAVVARDAGTVVHDRGTAPCPMKGGYRGRRCLFITEQSVMLWFIKIDLKQIYCSYSRTNKIQNVIL